LAPVFRERFFKDLAPVFRERFFKFWRQFSAQDSGCLTLTVQHWSEDICDEIEVMLALADRVARWLIFVPKNPNSAYQKSKFGNIFEGLGICCGSAVK
jgi:hypothetical protein